DNGVGPEVPFKAAGLRSLLSEVQSLLIYAQRLARALLFVNVGDQNDASDDIAAGVADRSATDADPSIYPIAPMIKNLLAGHDFPLKRPRQHGFTTLDTLPVHIIS